MEKNSGILKIIIAFVVGCLVGALIMYFVPDKEDNTNTNTDSPIAPVVSRSGDVDDDTLNELLAYVDIESVNNIGTAGELNSVLVEYFSEGLATKLDIINEYALANSLFESDEYTSEDDEECYPINEGDAVSGVRADHCYLLSKNSFNEINELYALDFDFSAFELAYPTYVVDGQYLYKQRIIIGGIWNEYVYNINSAKYTNTDKSEILIETTRITNTNLEQNIATENISYTFEKNDDNWYIKKIVVN